MASSRTNTSNTSNGRKGRKGRKGTSTTTTTTAAPPAPAAPVQSAVQAPAPMLRPQAVRVLRLLAAAQQPMSRKALAQATGQLTGWAALMGAHTRGYQGATGAAGLVPRGLVQAHVGLGPVAYTITSAGRELLAALAGAYPEVQAAASAASQQ